LVIHQRAGFKYIELCIKLRFSHATPQVLDIPDKVIETVICEMTPTQQSVYDSIIAEYQQQRELAAASGRYR